MVIDETPGDETDPSDLASGADVDAVREDEAEIESGTTRHYQQDPDGLVERARDPDEREQDEVLELDQRELDELGLTLEDPHQPEPE